MALSACAVDAMLSKEDNDDDRLFFASLLRKEEEEKPAVLVPVPLEEGANCMWCVPSYNSITDKSLYSIHPSIHLFIYSFPQKTKINRWVPEEYQVCLPRDATTATDTLLLQVRPLDAYTHQYISSLLNLTPFPKKNKSSRMGDSTDKPGSGSSQPARFLHGGRGC
jgi:hypothetical protein